MTDVTDLFSIIVTTAGRPSMGSKHLLRHNERFWVGRVISTTTGPPSVMPSWSVIFRIDQDYDDTQARATFLRSFALHARATHAEALRWHEIDEAHWVEHGYAPNHWEPLGGPMNDAVERLLERLQTGWQPTPAEIPAEVQQHHLERWRFIWSVRKRRVLLLGDPRS